MSILKNIKEKIKGVVDTVNSRVVQPLCNKVKMWCSRFFSLVQNIWLDVMTYVSSSPDDCELDKIETARAQLGAVAVIDAFREFVDEENPSLEEIVSPFIRMNCSERMQMIDRIQQNVSLALGVPPSNIIFFENNPKVRGFFEEESNTIAFNLELFSNPNITENEVLQLITTVLHEKYHHFQFTAMLKPRQYNMSYAEAKILRTNARNYIDSEYNPMGYWYQPLEVGARKYAASVIEILEITFKEES